MRYLSDIVGDSVDRRGLPKGWEDINIQGITADSREVRPGYIFAALPGAKLDGRNYISEAVKLRAAAILTSSLPEDMPPPPVPVLCSQNPRSTLARMAARFYELQPRFVTTVTGTDGKTSVAHFYQQLWALMDKPAASIGTLGVVSSVDMPDYPALNTSPDPVLLHRALADLARRSVQHVAIEASSIGLDQHRLDGANIRVAAFTNLTRDHLDYHKTEEAYLKAKLRLFAEVMAGGSVAVLNVDDPHFETFQNACRHAGHKIMHYGKNARDCAVLEMKPHATGQKVKLSLVGDEVSCNLPLLGGFQVMNILCAAGMAIACGADPEELAKALPKLKGVPGRLEHVAEHPNGAPVFVDYAHTPGGLESVLKHLRPHVKGKLVLVFGCGGDRDSGKRPIMGEIAAKHADEVFVTDDNPRSENPRLIRKDVMAGCPNAAEIEGRDKAIAKAMDSLGKDDALLIAGKGHEHMQIIGDVSHPFDDGEVARKAASKLKPSKPKKKKRAENDK